MTWTDEHNEMAPKPYASEHLISAPVDASGLSDVLQPYVEEIGAVLNSFDCQFTPYDGECLAGNSYDTIVGLSDENWPLIMRELNDSRKICDRVARESDVRAFVEGLLERKLKPFVINKVRINKPTLKKSQYSWHQDAATWPGLAVQFPIVKQALVYTFWLCITRSNKGNGLSVLPKEIPVQGHSFVEHQGYFKSDTSAVPTADAQEVYGGPYTAALFGHKVMHRSLSGSDYARLSLDLRYFHV